jgi:methionyl-tRNA synthetase
MAAGLPLPKQVFAHGWLLFEQEKMSKSKGNVAYAEPIVKVLGNDALRYYLLRETVFGQDGNFSREALITRYNADLANGLGNLASRVLTMIERNLNGVVPWFDSGVILTRDSETVESFTDENLAEISDLYGRFEFAQVVEKIWGLIATWDRYLATEKPWTYAGDSASRDRLERTLFTATEALRIISVLAHPVIPDATRKIWQQLGRLERLEDQRIDQLSWATSSSPTKLGKLEGVFPRADKKETLEKIEAMENEIRNPGAAAPATSHGSTASQTPAANPAPASAAAAGGAAPAAGGAAAAAAPAKIAIEDFAKVELRVGVVKSAERIQGADKLLKLLVDIGDEVRQVLAGIALGYTPEELVGRKVVIVANLAPRKMRGLESNGMLLAASVGSDGKPVLCTFAEDVPAGAKVK